MARLRRVEDDRLDALATAAWLAAAQYYRVLGRLLYRLADDAYVPWGGGADAPTGYVMTSREALDAGFPPERVRDAVDFATDGGFNRAGPGETCLTPEAMIEAYASEEAHRAFRLTPDKIRPITTRGREDPVTGEWDDITVYWTPWAPDEVPARLPDGMRDRF